MRCPKRGEVFQVEMCDDEYMSVVDKAGDMVRCISKKTKKQTSRSKASVSHIYTIEESASKLLDFYEKKGDI